MFGPTPTWAPVCTTGLIGILGSQQRSFKKVKWTVFQTELYHKENHCHGFTGCLKKGGEVAVSTATKPYSRLSLIQQVCITGESF